MPIAANPRIASPRHSLHDMTREPAARGRSLALPARSGSIDEGAA